MNNGNALNSLLLTKIGIFYKNRKWADKVRNYILEQIPIDEVIKIYKDTLMLKYNTIYFIPLECRCANKIDRAVMEPGITDEEFKVWVAQFYLEEFIRIDVMRKL